MSSQNGDSLIKTRQTMSYYSKLGQYYLGMRKKSLLRGVSKARIIPYTINFIQQLAVQPDVIPNICEIGCGNGIILGEIYNILKTMNLHNTASLTGFDYNEDLINIASRNFPNITFLKKDIAKDSLQEYKSHYNVVLSPNVLHEICSFYGREKNGKFNIKKGQREVKKVLEKIRDIMKTNGLLIIVDGAEYLADPNTQITFKINNKRAKKELEIFTKSYEPIKPKIEKLRGNQYKTTLQTFTRLVTKSRFTTLPVWNLEKEETYQYFNVLEYQDILTNLGFRIESLDLISPDIGTWSTKFEIITEGIQFPYEYMIITATKLD